MFHRFWYPKLLRGFVAPGTNPGRAQYSGLRISIMQLPWTDFGVYEIPHTFPRLCRTAQEGSFEAFDR